MQKSTISKRQFCVLLTFAPIVGKGSMLPSFVAAIAKNGTPFTVIIMMLIDMLMLFLIYKVQMAGGISVLKEKLPKFALIGFWFVSILITVLLTSLMLAGFTHFVTDNLYDNISMFPTIVISIILVIYMGLKGTQTVGRLTEILIWFMPITLFIALAIGKTDIRFECLFPILWSNTGPVFKAAFMHILWSLNYFPFLFINVENIKSKRPKIGVYAVSVILLEIFLSILFIASFGNSAAGVSYGFARLTGYSSLTSKLGSFDWLGIIFWLIYILVVLGFFYASSPTLLELAEVKYARQLSVAFLAVGDTLLLTKIFKSLVEFQNFGTSIYSFIISGCAFLIVIAVLLIINKVKKDETES